MIYYLGIREDNVILFNPDVKEFKKLKIDTFFKHICDKSYSEIKMIIDSESDSKDEKIKKLNTLFVSKEFPLCNYRELSECLVYGKECKYFLEKVSSLYMYVATADLKTDIEIRLNNSSIILNAESYWMTWPESVDYNYGSEIPCSAFSYHCPLNQSFIESKDEIKNFANTGIADTLSRYEMMGMNTGCYESQILPGLLSWRCNLEPGDYDVVEIPDGVNVIEKDCIPDKVKINRLIYPESVLFMLPGSLSKRVGVHDMRKANITSLYHIIDTYYYPGDKLEKIYFPKVLKELNRLRNRNVDVILSKECEKLRDVDCDTIIIENDSNIYYLGSKLGNKFIITDDVDKSSFKNLPLNILKLPKLRYFEPDTFYKDINYRYYNYLAHIIGIDWSLDDVNYNLKKKLSRVTTLKLELPGDSKAYEILKDIPCVKEMDEF